MTRPPEWLLDGYAKSGIQEFVDFAERSRFLSGPQIAPEPPFPVSPVAGPVSPSFSAAGGLKSLEQRLEKVSEGERRDLLGLLGQLDIQRREAYLTVRDVAVVGDRTFLRVRPPELAVNGWPSLVVLDTVEHHTRLLLTFDLADVVRTHGWRALMWEPARITAHVLTLMRDTPLAPQLYGTIQDLAAFLEEEKLYLTMILSDTVFPERPDDQAALLGLLSTFVGVHGFLPSLYTQLQDSEETRTVEPEHARFHAVPPKPSEGFALSSRLFDLAGLTYHGEHDGLSAASWMSGGLVRRSGLAWQEADDDRPYPLLTCINSFVIEEEQADALVMVAVDDHFMQMNLPPELLSQVGRTWLVARTLTPAIHGVPQEDGNVQVHLISSWPMELPPTPAMLRFCALTSFGQALDLLIRSGLDTDPDLVHPGAIGAGIRGWLNTDALLRMVGDELTWKVTRENEIQCQVSFPINGETQDFCLYLRFVDEGDQEMPTIALRCHTLSTPARDNEGAVAQYLLDHSNAMRQGQLLPITVDQDGDLCVRQIILCPEEPTIGLVWPLVMSAVSTLGHAISTIA